MIVNFEFMIRLVYMILLNELKISVCRVSDHDAAYFYDILMRGEQRPHYIWIIYLIITYFQFMMQDIYRYIGCIK